MAQKFEAFNLFTPKLKLMMRHSMVNAKSIHRNINIYKKINNSNSSPTITAITKWTALSFMSDSFVNLNQIDAPSKLKKNCQSTTSQPSRVRYNTIIVLKKNIKIFFFFFLLASYPSPPYYLLFLFLQGLVNYWVSAKNYNIVGKLGINN